MPNISQKVCPKCGETKTAKEFHKNRASKDGLHWYCKPCRSIYNIEYQKRPEVRHRKNARLRHRYKYDSNYRQRTLAHINAHDKANPEQKRARKAVQRAVKSGVLPAVKTQSCAKCGTAAQEYHHHKGYDKEDRLEVMPLCRSCHRRIHR